MNAPNAALAATSASDGPAAAPLAENADAETVVAKRWGPPRLPAPPPAGPDALARFIARLRAHLTTVEGKKPVTVDIIEHSFLRWRLGLTPIEAQPLRDLQQVFAAWRRMEVEAGKVGGALPQLSAAQVLGALPEPPCPSRGGLSVVLVAEGFEDGAPAGVRARCPGCGALAWIEGVAASHPVARALQDALLAAHPGAPFPVVLWETPSPAQRWAEVEAERLQAPQRVASLRPRVQMTPGALG